MSSLSSIIEYYNKGLRAKNEKNFLRAARYFRMCYYHYQEGELPWFDDAVKRCGVDSTHQYYSCKSELTDDAQHMLEEERKNKLNEGWRELVHFTYNKILEEWEMPSPNRMKKHKQSKVHRSQRSYFSQEYYDMICSLF